MAENMADILDASGLFVVLEGPAPKASADAENIVFPPAFYDYFELEAA